MSCNVVSRSRQSVSLDGIVVSNLEWQCSCFGMTFQLDTRLAEIEEYAVMDLSYVNPCVLRIFWICETEHEEDPDIWMKQNSFILLILYVAGVFVWLMSLVLLSYRTGTISSQARCATIASCPSDDVFLFYHAIVLSISPFYSLCLIIVGSTAGLPGSGRLYLMSS